MAHTARYIFSGLVAAGVTLLLLHVLTMLTSIWYPITASVSYAAGFFISFNMQKFWTFENSDVTKVRSQLVIYVLVGIFNILVNGVLVYLLAEITLLPLKSFMSVPLYILSAQVVSGAIIALESYFIYRHYIFKRTDIHDSKEI